jgi:hypothetical protein
MSDSNKKRHFIPLSKLSKKKQRAYHISKRGSWGEVNPVTRKPPNPKAYIRKRKIINEEER